MSTLSAAKKAGQKAEELHKQVYTTTVEDVDPAQEAAQAAPEESKPDQEAQPVAKQEVKVDTSQNTQEQAPASQENAPDDTVWEQRYKTLQGMWKKDVPELQSENQTLKARLAELESKVTQAQATQSAPPEELPKYLTPEDVEEFGDDMLEIVRRAAKEELAPDLARIEAENRRLKQQLEGVGSSVVQTERQRVLSELDRRLPNWREINQSPEFLEWLQQVDPYSGQKKHDMLLSAFESNDINRMSVFFDGFIGETAAVNTEGQATSQRVPPVDVDKLVAPGTPRSGGGNARNQVDNSRVWTEQEIAHFYNDVTAGKFRSEAKQKEKAKIEREIHKALRENRVRPSSFQPSY